jgi:hypothetical protein
LGREGQRGGARNVDGRRWKGRRLQPTVATRELMGRKKYDERQR